MTEKTEQKAKPPSQLTNWLLAGVAGVGTALIAAGTTIRQRFFDDIRHIPEIDKHLKDVAGELHTLWEKAPAMSRKGYFSELASIKVKGDAAFCTIMEKHHFRSNGLDRYSTGILDRANSMSKNSRHEIIINSVITAAIAVGGTYMFLNNRSMREQLSRIEAGHDKAQETAAVR